MTQDPIRYVDITPTLEGMRMIIQVLLEQIEASREKMKQAKTILDLLDQSDAHYALGGQNIPLIEEAVELLITQERERIQRIQAGLSLEGEEE